MPGRFRSFARMTADLRRSTREISRREALAAAKASAVLTRTTLQLKRARKNNDVKLLDSAIEAHRTAVAALKSALPVIKVDNPGFLAGMNHLAVALLTRYLMTGVRA